MRGPVCELPQKSNIPAAGYIKTYLEPGQQAHVAQLAEHTLGKGEVHRFETDRGLQFNSGSVYVQTKFSLKTGTIH